MDESPSEKISLPLKGVLLGVWGRIPLLRVWPCYHHVVAQLVAQNVVARCGLTWLLLVWGDVGRRRSVESADGDTDFLLLFWGGSRLCVWPDLSDHLHFIRVFEGSRHAWIVREELAIVARLHRRLFLTVFCVRWEGSCVEFHWGFSIGWFFVSIDKIIDSHMDDVTIDCTDESVIWLLRLF